MQLRKKLDEKYVQSKFEINSRTLDDILSSQRPSSDKSRLGYDKEKKPEYSFSQTKMKEDMLLHSRRKKVRNNLLSYKKSDMIPGRPMTSIFQQIFFCHYYSSNNFGHRDMN